MTAFASLTQMKGIDMPLAEELTNLVRRVGQLADALQK